jgi:hypothetical protein
MRLPELNRRGIEALERTAGLYAIEKEIRGLSAEERCAVQAKPKEPAKQEIKQADKNPERPSAQLRCIRRSPQPPSHGGGDTMIGVGF